jgi:hypothetical protein
MAPKLPYGNPRVWKSSSKLNFSSSFYYILVSDLRHHEVHRVVPLFASIRHRSILFPFVFPSTPRSPSFPSRACAAVAAGCSAMPLSRRGEQEDKLEDARNYKVATDI